MILTEKQTDLLTEVVNIGIGRSANILNKFVKSKVKLEVPSIKLIHIEDFSEHLGHQDDNLISLISMGFSGELKGNVALVFSSEDARKIVDIISDKEYEQMDMDQMRSSALNEVGNIVLNSLIGTLGNLLKYRFRYRIPRFTEIPGIQLSRMQDMGAEYLIFANTYFQIKDHKIDGNFLLLFEVGSLNPFLERLDKKLAGID